MTEKALLVFTPRNSNFGHLIWIVLLSTDSIFIFFKALPYEFWKIWLLNRKVNFDYNSSFTTLQCIQNYVIFLHVFFFLPQNINKETVTKATSIQVGRALLINKTHVKVSKSLSSEIYTCRSWSGFRVGDLEFMFKQYDAHKY